MQDIVFLGIFDKIANWIMSGITKVLTWLISNIIAPICSAIWESFVSYIVEFIGEILATFVYKLYAFILSILYAIETAVYSFAGATNVNYQGKQDNIISIIFQQPAVKTAFWYITALAVVLLFIFTVITVIKTTLDFGYDGKRNMGTILTQFFTSAITFLILPAFCYGLIDLTSRVMNALFIATSMGGTNSLTDNLFLLSIRSNVGNTGAENYITVSNYNTLVNKIAENEMYWYDFSEVIKYIGKATNVDYIIGIIGAVVILINLMSMAGTFIQRVIEIIVLYIVSPLFVATIPLDDGERFGRWRRTFIGRLCMGVGMIVALNIVMMILCIVISGSDGYTISFTENIAPSDNIVAAASNKSVDIILKIVFIVGSLLAVKNLGSTITSIIDQEAGFEERASVHENSERLKRIPGAVAGAIGAAKFAADYTSKLMNEHNRQSIVKGSVSRGFSGEVANAREQEFADMIKRQNISNSSKAVFTNRGNKYSALKGQIEKGNKALSDFRQLKTHAEREQFMANFNKAGGINSLKVDGSKFVKSDMTNMSERKALSNLDKRIEMTKASRDKLAKNSEGWKKLDGQLNSLSRIRNQFDMLNTHKERESFIKSHSEFGDLSKLNKAEQGVASRLKERAQEAKEARDMLPKGSAEWKKADEKYQNIMQKYAQFTATDSHDARSRFTAENPLARADSHSGREKNALRNLNEKKRRALEYRNLFKEGSEGWKLFDSQVKQMDQLADKFNSIGTRAEREAFINANPVFKSREAMSSGEIKNLENLNKNMNRAAALRDKYSQGSDEWNKFDKELSSLVKTKAAFVAIDSRAGRENFISSNAAAFTDNTSSKENMAINNINARKLTALNSRNMFRKGSDEWNFYDKQIKNFESLEAKMQTISSKAEREAFIDSNAEFGQFENISGKDAYRNALNSNLSRAIQNRNRHAVNSPKWKQCNDEARTFAVARAKYDSLATSDEKRSFAQENMKLFTDSMAGDNDYSSIEQKYNSWNALSQYASDPGIREHAHKMAKTYAGYSERYQRAESPEGRSDLMTEINDFEANSSSTSGIGFTAKEYAGVKKVMDTGNETIIKRYLNAQSHGERRDILDGVANGIYSRFEEPDDREDKFALQLVQAGSAFEAMAEKTTDKDLKSHYVAMGELCSNAGVEYSALNTHSQRELFAEYIGNEISNAGNTGDVAVPKMAAPDITERESAFISKLNDDEKKEFTSLNSHRARYQFMDKYYVKSKDFLEMSVEEADMYNNYLSGNQATEFERTAQYRTAFLGTKSHEVRKQIMEDYADYITSAPESERPENWTKINTEGLSYYQMPQSQMSQTQMPQFQMPQTGAGMAANSRFEEPDDREDDFAFQLAKTGSAFEAMAESTSNQELKSRYSTMGKLCFYAGVRYNYLGTHSQRELFAEYIGNEISSVKDIGGVAVPKMAAPDITEKESEFISKLSDEQVAEFKSLNSHRARHKYMDKYYTERFEAGIGFKMSDDEQETYNKYFSGTPATELEQTAQYRTDFLAATSHEERKQIMADYIDYLTGAPESERPENWTKINTGGLSYNSMFQAEKDVTANSNVSGTQKMSDPYPDSFAYAEGAVASEAESIVKRSEEVERIVKEVSNRKRSNSIKINKTNKEYFKGRNLNNNRGGHE